jgi:hypothetical protein
MLSVHCLLAQIKPLQLAVDPFGNRYEVYQEKVLKFDAADALLFHNGFPQCGSIHHLDITNPLKPCLFFFDTQKILCIDNTLSGQNLPIDLSKTLSNGILPYYTAGCVSANGGFWCFDNVQKKIIRMDIFGQTLFELANLHTYLAKASWNILWMQESNNQLFLRDENYLHCFDFTGSYQQSIEQIFYPTFAYQGNIFEINPNGLHIIFPLFIPIPNIRKSYPPFTIANGKYFDAQTAKEGVNIQEFVNK